MDSTQLLVTLIGAGGGGAALLALINGLIKYLSGSAGRERIRNTTLKDQRNEAWAERDKAWKEVAEERKRADLSDARADREARNRRRTEEYASQLRRDCTEHGMAAEELRPWPQLEKEPSETPPT
ncbi:hypothetical protein QEH68_06785 [Paenarthrobacter sp. OM7]|uniref:hypothetical protein n=1 Tax=Paenarthrobacter sp. OM7 TaxID=3041264 RepID=UPI002468AF72|nr:hypothetical protein [Paenarthrobacter sp. OM7]WGM21874.1 hypothetical protein QEH68_06785 [Paenarthrobacter sp. OM7]